ncbi:MAG TPA: anthranilate phosphoribosyltransferase [Elusimicrobiota bacterium]|nr:anthranilate phosphoribosyltransferase [Elusimicrobiota bacterium]
MIQETVVRLVEKNSLSSPEAREAMEEILSGTATPSQIAGFLTALRMKGETPEEIAGCAEAMRGAATRIPLETPVIVDTCGTGGDKKGAFNVSTAAAFVVAGAGFTVAKHGNRSISSQCGSADVLEELGVKIDPPVAVVERCLREIGIGFMFAPAFHPAMRHAMPTRRELGVRTVFNILGPLCNPAGANVQVLGVYSPDLLDVLAQVLVRLGMKHSMVVHGGGYDEITLSGETLAAEIVDGRVQRIKLSAKDFGVPAHPDTVLRGGDKKSNAEILRKILKGIRGPQRDVVVANAGTAILLASRAAGKKTPRNRDEACREAERVLDSGAALKKLDRLAELSHAAS